MTGAEIEAAYLAVLFVPAMVGMTLGIINRSGRAPGALCAVSCIAGVLCYPFIAYTGGLSYELPTGSFLGAYALSFDQLGSVFVSISSIVFLAILTHMSHSGHGYTARYSALCCALFLAVTLCMCADTAILILLAWEAVSMITFLMAGNGRDDSARWRFLAVTHIGGLILMAVYGYMWSVSGSGYLHDWEGLGIAVGPTTSAILVLLLFLGFGTKLGTVPFHAWMPDMYAESPTHTTALLTTVCSNAAILMLFRAVYSYIGAEGLTDIGMIVCILAAVTALWGAMESMVQTEPKRILAYSSMENMALVTLCLALGLVFWSSSDSLTALVILAAVLHTLNHSIFKSLMLLTVDSVEDVTGERKIDRMGGLAKVLPALSAVALVGVASLAAIPPMNGFISEWLMLQSLVGTDAIASDLRVAMPLLVAMMGVCGMIVATSYARLFGFIFLGRPRSEGAAKPRPMRKGSITPMAVLAVLCIGMGMLSYPLMDVLSEGTCTTAGIDASYRDGMSGSLEPLTLGIMILGTVAFVYVASRVLSRNSRETDTWGCGGTLDGRMQYSSEGFSQPIVRVFHPFYGDTSGMENGRYHTRFQEPFVKYIYNPLGNILFRISRRVSRLQTGNIQTYLGYILATLVVALMAVRLL